MNESKIRDPRMWRKWKESGAIATPKSPDMPVMSVEQIADAANTLFQIEKKYLRPELVDERGLAATLTLKAAGRDAVRAVCEAMRSFEHLDPQFWAIDREVLIAKKLIALHVLGGGLLGGVKTYLNVGPDIPRLAEDRNNYFPQLSERAKQRLLSYASSLILKEASMPYESVSHVLRTYRI